MTAQITTINKLREIITEDHVLSYGVIFSLGSFMLGKIRFLSHLCLAEGRHRNYISSVFFTFSEFSDEALF